MEVRYKKELAWFSKQDTVYVYTKSLKKQDSVKKQLTSNDIIQNKFDQMKKCTKNSFYRVEMLCSCVMGFTHGRVGTNYSLGSLDKTKM